MKKFISISKAVREWSPFKDKKMIRYYVSHQLRLGNSFFDLE